MNWLNDAALTPLLGTYAVGDEQSLTNPTLLHLVRQFKRTLSGQLRPADTSGAPVQIPKADDYLITRKADGEFAFLVVEGAQGFLLNPGGTVRTGLPLTDEAAACFGRGAPLIVAGELTAGAPGKDRERVREVFSLVRGPKSRGDVDRLHFSVFDLVMHQGDLVEVGLRERWELLSSLVPADAQRLHVVEGHWGDRSAVLAAIKQWVEEDGAEGVVVRSDAIGGFKIKQRHTLDVAVVGFSEGSDDRREMIHSLLVALLRSDGLFHLTAHVGGGFSEEERHAFFEALMRRVCQSDVREVNSQGVAFRMVEPGWVIEMSCLDALVETSKGRPIRRTVASFEPEQRIWRPLRQLPLVSLISPQFIRVRHDKAVHHADVGLRQLEAVAAFEAVEESPRFELPPSRLLRRQVWTKVMKAGLMVRKLLLIQTNKEDYENHPAYVVYGVDFSPGRAEPLQRDIRVSNSQTQIETLYEGLRDDYVRKGWELVAEGKPSGALPDTSGTLPF